MKEHLRGQKDKSEKFVYQLKIVLKGIRPPIWRRLLVPQNITFNKLHKIIQAAFGWQDYHLFQFEFNDTIIHIPDPEYPLEKRELNARRIKIDEWLQQYRRCLYVYDFGDNWQHEVILEKILPAEEGEKYPVCIAGARHRPPEDVGGVSGYKEFLRVISDPSHPQHNDYLLWAEKDTGGRKFDPDYFCLDEVNRALAKIK